MSTDEQTLSTEPGVTTVATTENVTVTESAVEQPKEEVKTEEQKISEQIENKLEEQPVKKKHIGGLNTHPENINRGGRPKREWTWAGLLEEYADQIHAKSGKTFKELIGKRLLHDSANGNIHATRELMNRMDGMPKQQTDVTSGGEKLDPIRVVIVEDKKEAVE